MAELVNAQEQAYSKLDNLKNIHTAMLKEIKRELKKTKGLVEEKNGFQIEKTSKKVKDLLRVYEEQILPNLEKTFEVSEESVKAMGRMLIEKDKVKV